MNATSDPSTWHPDTLLGRLDPAEADLLLRLGEEHAVSAAHVILREGVRGSHVVLLRRALTKVTVNSAEGRDVLLAIRASGDMVGEMAALNAAPRSATVTACEQSLITVIATTDLRAFLRAHPDVAFEIAAMVADRLRWADQRWVHFTAYPVEMRLARILVDLATRFGFGHTADGGCETGVRLTQPELSTLTGAAEVSVQRALRKFRTAGSISTARRRIVIHDLSALRAAAGPLGGPHPADAPDHCDRCR